MYTDLVYTGCAPPNGILTRARQWLGIGGVPRMSSQQYAAFERGAYTVGQPRVRQIEEQKMHEKQQRESRPAKS